MHQVDDNCCKKRVCNKCDEYRKKLEMITEFNINNIVKVKLTDLGKEIYLHQYDDLNNAYGKKIVEPGYPLVDNDGYTPFQLWHLMELYGNYLKLTGTVENNTLPFETAILLG